MKSGVLLTSGNGWRPLAVAAGHAVAAGLLTLPPARPPVSQSTPGATGSARAFHDSLTRAPRPSLREGRATPLHVAAQAIACGVNSLILLDLAGVGEGRGVPTLDLCRAVRSIAPHIELITGGGVRHVADLAALESAGVNGVLIASALHDGSLTPGMCERWRH
jgi:hypothetical protein